MLRGQLDGSRFWAVRIRRDDKPRRVTFGTVTLDQSRAAASALLAREKSGAGLSPAGFRTNAYPFRGGVCRASFVLKEAVHTQGDHELPAPVHTQLFRDTSRVAAR